MFKPFKVAAVSENANTFGLHGHVLIAEDGEAWEVAKCRISPPLTGWDKGDIVQVPYTDNPTLVLRPLWHQLGCEIPRRLPDAPDSVVREVWHEKTSTVA